MLEECPRSFIRGESVGLVEEFLLRRRMGFGEVWALHARSTEAFVILQGEMEREITNGTSEDSGDISGD